MTHPWLSHYESDVTPTLDVPQQTVGEFLTRAARERPQHIATRFVLQYVLGGRLTIGGTLTFAQLSDAVDRMANAFHHMGIRPGDRIALMLPNSPHYLIAFFAALRVGAIVVNINPTYTSRELGHLLQDSGAETIVMLNLFWPRLREIQATTNIKRTIVAYLDDTLPPPQRLLVRLSQKRQPEWVSVRAEQSIFRFSRLLRKYSPQPPYVAVSPDAIALFQYTGGTTGIPKAAMLTHRNLVANTLQVAAWLPDAKLGHEKVMAAIPFFHVYGMTVCMIYGMHLQGELVVVPNPRPIHNVMRVIEHERCTIFPGVPAMYIGIVNHPHVRDYDLRSVRACISGSAPLPMDIQEKFGAITGGRLVEGYGLSEASPVTHANPVYGVRKPGSIGIPLPSVEAKAIDMQTGDALPIPSNQPGELCVRGPQVMQGYWQRPEETAATIDAEGWLHTGDICTTDEDGYFYVVDRKKDMINASGFKVLPREVEEVLFMHPEVLEAVVAGIPHRSRGDDTVKAYVVRKPGSNVSVATLQEFCKERLAPYKVPRQIEFRDELPKTTVGKVLRRVLVEEELKKRGSRQRDREKDE